MKLRSLLYCLKHIKAIMTLSTDGMIMGDETSNKHFRIGISTPSGVKKNLRFGAVSNGTNPKYLTVMIL
jgi:hypothetical protein